jgi:4-hydroxy-tetrahydrodipicolinate synthase
VVSGRFGSVVTAMVTPFDGAGALALDRAVELARHLESHGSDALVLAGTTGEGPVLSDQEKLDLFSAVASQVSVPVLAATGSNDTAHSVDLTRRAAATGVAGLLVVTPYYNRPSPAGIAAHFRAIAQASDLPIVLYDIPVRTGRRIGTDQIVALAREVPTIVGLKDATGDVAGAARVAAACPDGFDVYSGDDALTLPILSVGGVGVISVAAHWAGTAFGQLIRAFRQGAVDEATAINAALDESYRFQSTADHPNPVPAKAMCRALGLAVGQCRLPHPPAPASLDVEAAAVFDRLRAVRPEIADQPHGVRQSVA